MIALCFLAAALATDDTLVPPPKPVVEKTTHDPTPVANDGTDPSPRRRTTRRVATGLVVAGGVGFGATWYQEQLIRNSMLAGDSSFSEGAAQRRWVNLGYAISYSSIALGTGLGLYVGASSLGTTPTFGWRWAW